MEGGRDGERENQYQLQQNGNEKKKESTLILHEGTIILRGIMQVGGYWKKKYGGNPISDQSSIPTPRAMHVLALMLSFPPVL